MRIAVDFMCPVIFLSDGYIANGAEPWQIPKVVGPQAGRSSNTRPSGTRRTTSCRTSGTSATCVPGPSSARKGLEHRIGGLEKADVTGNVEYSPTNHQHMTDIRAAKVAGIADFIPEQTVEGPESGELLVVSWGGTYGSVRTAVRQVQSEGKSVAHCHLRYMNPFPRNLGEILKSYEKVLVPELNRGQLRFLLRNQFLVDAKGLNKIQGKPFLISEIAEAIRIELENGRP